jgi:hypothetical protein
MPIALLIPVLHLAAALVGLTTVVVQTYEPGAVIVEKVQHDLREHWHLNPHEKEKQHP